MGCSDSTPIRPVVPVAAPMTQAGHPATQRSVGAPVNTIRFQDRVYRTMEDLQNDMAAAGIEDTNMIIGIDFTASNQQTGRHSRNGLNLHHHTADNPSFYVRVMDAMMSMFAGRFDVDGIIPVYGFGDAQCNKSLCFSLGPDLVQGVPRTEIVQRYLANAAAVSLAGPTSFAALIAHACDVVATTNFRYHVLLIITDGAVCDDGETVRAVAAASKFPLSIVIIGVGDGPFGIMEQLDDGNVRRDFDNVQFVAYRPGMSAIDLCKNAAAEIAQQYHAVRQLGLMKRHPRPALFSVGEDSLMLRRPPSGFCIPGPVSATFMPAAIAPPVAVPVAQPL